jgi:cephalosporin hydroxylase
VIDEPDPLRTFESTFAGVPAAQYWSDFCLWEHLLNWSRPASIVELGTGRGGMALYLATQAQLRGLHFATHDHAPPLVRVPAIEPFFREGDVLREPERVVLDPKPLVLFCDDGDKPREIETFAPRLEAGDLLAVHNWGVEVGPRRNPHAGQEGSPQRQRLGLDDVPVELLEPVLVDLCLSLDSPTRVFRRL